MIQFNLLPDVKLEYIKARRARRLIIGISVITVGISIGILVLVFSVGALQKKHLHDLSADITKESKQLENVPQLNKILTVQNQLLSLSGLHDGKPSATRLFGYLNELTPANVNISSFKIDFVEHTVTIQGDADALASVNKYIDTLKFTTYHEDKETSDKPKAFSDVVLSSFGVANANQGKGNSAPQPKATYSITLSYDEQLFDITKNIALTVPKLITTRSQLDQPTDLFTPPITKPENEGTQ